MSASGTLSRSHSSEPAWLMAWQRVATKAEGTYIILGGLGLVLVLTVACFTWSGFFGAKMEGTVVYHGQPLSGAKVYVVGSRAAPVTSDESGKFTLRGVPRGTVTVMVEAGGLRSGYPLRVDNPRTGRIGTLELYDWRPPSD